MPEKKRPTGLRRGGGRGDGRGSGGSRFQNDFIISAAARSSHVTREGDRQAWQSSITITCSCAAARFKPKPVISTATAKTPVFCNVRLESIRHHSVSVWNLATATRPFHSEPSPEYGHDCHPDD